MGIIGILMIRFEEQAICIIFASLRHTKHHSMLSSFFSPTYSFFSASAASSNFLSSAFFLAFSTSTFSILSNFSKQRLISSSIWLRQSSSVLSCPERVLYSCWTSRMPSWYSVVICMILSTGTASSGERFLLQMLTMPAISPFSYQDCCWQLRANSAACWQISVNFWSCSGVTYSYWSPYIQIITKTHHSIATKAKLQVTFHINIRGVWIFAFWLLLLGIYPLVFLLGVCVLAHAVSLVQQMLAIEKSKDLVEQIGRILRRMQHIKQVRTQQSEFLTELQQLYTSYAQRTHKEMVIFEEQLIKNILYSAHKTNPIVNLAKLYRDFALQLDRTARLNLLSLGRIRSEELVAQEQRLTRKCELFLKEFQGYLAAEKTYNAHYSTYSDKCALLDQTIRRYRSYQDPLAFYSYTLTSEYIAELDRHYNECSNFQTTIINDTQGLDQTRKWMGDHVKEINEYYVILLHVYLNTVQATINAIVEPNPDPPDKPALRSSHADQIDPQPALHAELQKLNHLYASELNNQQHVEDNVADDYSELFKKSFVQEVSSDSKFFYDRCENMRGKKLKATEEVLRIQSLLIDQLTKQCSSYTTFEKEYRAIQRDIFTNNGIDSFKKRFRKYFGSNFMEVQELCFAIVDRQKRSLDRVAKSTEDSREKLGRLLQGKQQSVRLFEKRTKALLEDHLKLKEKAQCRKLECDVKTFKDSIASSFNELKKSFQELQKNESQVDKLFFSTLKSHCEVIQKEGLARNLSRILEKEKIRLNILRSLNVDSQIILILKEDSRYQMLMNECPKPNLYASFQSLTKKKEYDEAKSLLQKKENRLKGMIRSKQGCCGISSEPIKHDIRSEHKCKLVANGKKTKGTLNITASGLIFEETTWLPFAQGLRLTVPQSDIISFDTRMLNEKEVVQVGTDFGSLYFSSKSCTQIVESMQKNITFKYHDRKEGSEKGKRNDSSSFIKNNTSTEFKLSYDKSLGNGSSTDAFRPLKDKPQSKPKSTDLIKDFIRRWKEENFLSGNFTRIVKNLGDKEGSRRDYQYSSGANKFVLKQRREVSMQGKDVVLSYEWKVCFPDTPMLHSFKHSQRVFVEGGSKELQVRIVTAPLSEEQLFIRNKFYREIEEMNDRLAKFIVNALQKEADVVIKPENQGEQSLNSSDIIIYEVNPDERLERADPTLRSSRAQRPRSSNQSPSSVLKL